MPMKTPVRLMSTTLRNRSTLSVSRNMPVEIPALLTSPSTEPNSSRAYATTRCQSSSMVTSRCWYRAASPSSRAVAAPSSSRTSARTTRAPTATAWRAASAPRPRAPPVMMTVLPLRSFMVLSFRPRAPSPAAVMRWSRRGRPGRAARRSGGGARQVLPGPVGQGGAHQGQGQVEALQAQRLRESGQALLDPADHLPVAGPGQRRVWDAGADPALVAELCRDAQAAPPARWPVRSPRRRSARPAARGGDPGSRRPGPCPRRRPGGARPTRPPARLPSVPAARP